MLHRMIRSRRWTIGLAKIWVALLLSLGFLRAAPQQAQVQLEKRYAPEKPEIRLNRPAPSPTPAGSAVSDLDRFRTSRQPDQLLSSTIDGDHEDAGVETSGGGSYSGVFAVHAVYSVGELKLKLPDDAIRTQTLFAATTRPPNGACLELGTAYTTDLATKKTTAALYVYDFCKPNKPDWGIAPFPVDGQAQIKIDDQFLQTYAGAAVEKARAYSMMIFTKDVPPSKDSLWLAQLYNYDTKTWDTVYQSKGVYIYDPRGWSIFETWYQKGQCSESLPLLGANKLAYFNYSTAAWESVAQHMKGLDTYINHGGDQNNCFKDDSTGHATYTISPEPPAYEKWSVTSKDASQQ